MVTLRRRRDCCVKSWWQGFEHGWEQAEKGTTKLEDHKLLRLTQSYVRRLGGSFSAQNKKEKRKEECNG